MGKQKYLAFALLLMGCSSTPCVVKEDSAAPSQSRPPAVDDEWKGLNEHFALEAQRVWTFHSGSEFGLKAHTAIAEQSGRCSDKLVWAQYRQDFLKQFDSAAHFDNCAFEPALQYIGGELSEVDALLAAPKDPSKAAHEAMAHLGRVIHALQDFYAHTNWVELQHEQGVPFSPEDLVVRVWEESGRTRLKQTPGLVSGTVWWNGPKKCCTSALSHGKMNKDGATSPSGSVELSHWNRSAYGAALELAENATGSFLAWAYARWPILDQVCGNDLYIVQTSDRRRE